MCPSVEVPSDPNKAFDGHECMNEAAWQR